MKITWINDWQYLFKDWAVGGRFASFTFIMVSYLNVGKDAPDLDINGFTIILFGLGIRVRSK